ncbi:MAG TPA: HD domain-containing phosphohydrolase [Acidobacteriota bacterium]|nr:HD domain-containing phosphohydrolase [Acidobacteriota bacterium]
MNEPGALLTTRKILCVDDDENILSAYQRQLRREFQIDTALGGEAALETIAQRGPYAVIISDMRMPGMDGVKLLSKVKEAAPDSVRMMLTGNGDLQTAMQAVNEGNIFRFLTKPCPPESLAKALTAGLEQYKLIIAERELLENTLSGSVRVLTEILSIIEPRSFGRAEMLRDLVKLVARQMGLRNSWELEIAAMLSQLGIVTVPTVVLAKARAGRVLSSAEKNMLVRMPEIGRKLLAEIPRLEAVAQIVLYQNKRFDGTGFPADSVAGKDIPLGSRILKILTDLLQIESLETSRFKALHLLRTRVGWYDPELLDKIISCLPPPAEVPAEKPRRTSSIDDLRVGQVLLSDVMTTDGVLILSSGHRISEASLERIRNIAQTSSIREPILAQEA